MTEAEWQTFTDLEVPLRGGLDRLAEHTEQPLSQRKLRLFLVACVRRDWHVFQDPRSRFAVDTTEHCADGLMTWEEAVAADEQVINPPNPDCLEPETWPPQQNPGYCLIQALVLTGERTIDCFAALQGARWAQDALGEAAKAGEEVAQAAILRDIFGNPFNAIAVDPSWLTPAVVQLARDIYENRTYAQLPILADALETAGCDSKDILAHCRQPGPHVKGCWLLDAILGKE